MAPENKKLLSQDLCTRLFHGVKVSFQGQICTIDTASCDATFLLKGKDGYVPNIEEGLFIDIDRIKPYLRPMSSMTEEELTELSYNVFQQPDIDIVRRWVFENKLYSSIDGNPVMVIDWLNANHFDYRGLIEKGLALEAPDGMYNLKE